MSPPFAVIILTQSNVFEDSCSHLFLSFTIAKKFLNFKFFPAQTATNFFFSRQNENSRNLSRARYVRSRKWRQTEISWDIKNRSLSIFSGNTDRYISLRDILVFHYNLTCKVSFLFKGGGPSHLSLLRKRKSWHKKSHIGFFFVLAQFFFLSRAPKPKNETNSIVESTLRRRFASLFAVFRLVVTIL